jgi:two-component sensor histidine kinase
MEQAPDILGTVPRDIFITDRLAARPPRRENLRLENRALQELVASLKDAQEEVLPRFVDIAMRLTGGVAAGLSLFEADDGSGFFRWRHLRGLLAAFEGRTTPRHDSPCGVALDENRPILARHAERFYRGLAATGREVPEMLLAPLRAGAGAPAGTLWIVSDAEDHFDSGDARVASELAAFITVALHLAAVRRSLEDAAAQQDILIHEMSHRVKNLFAVAEGLVRISARGSDTKAEMAESLIGRFHALAGAHSLIRPGFSADAHSTKVSDLASLLSAIVKPHERASGPSRFVMDGPAVALGDRAITGIALAFHELTTNAVKHGALKDEDGQVSILWDVEDGMLAIAWDEGGSAAATAPAEGGFGSKLLNDTIARQFAGSLEHLWGAGGLKVNVRIPLQRLAD